MWAWNCYEFSGAEGFGTSVLFCQQSRLSLCKEAEFSVEDIKTVGRYVKFTFFLKENFLKINLFIAN